MTEREYIISAVETLNKVKNTAIEILKLGEDTGSISGGYDLWVKFNKAKDWRNTVLIYISDI